MAGILPDNIGERPDIGLLSGLTQMPASGWQQYMRPDVFLPEGARALGNVLAPDLTAYLTTPSPMPGYIPNAAGKIPPIGYHPNEAGAAADLFNLITSLPTPGKMAAMAAVAPMMGRMGRGLEVFAPKLEGIAPQGIRAYHGSPHDFDRFDLSRIGTGEGAQAYGHGLYFAENEGVAKAYRDTLSRGDKQWFVDGEVVGTYGQNSGALGGAAGRLRQVMGRDGIATEADAAAALRALEQVNKNNPGMIPKAHFDDVSRAIPQLVGRKVSESAPGRMYEVNINARPEQFLDWDKPLAGQATPVRELAGRRAQDTTTGAEAYRLISDRFGGTRDMEAWPRASDELREAGIPGIKYLDQGSRNTTEWVLRHPQGGVQGFPDEQSARTFLAKNPEYALEPPKQTSNYVLFDDKLIDILRKYAIPGMIAPPAAFAVTQGAGQQQ